jgi:single-strand DNA-binding protein
MTNFYGNISKAAETRTVMVGGVPTLVTDFNIAENYQAANGEKATQFYRITLWRDRGTKLAQYLTKGRLVAVEGRVKARAYIDKNGQAQCQLEMSNPRITLLGANKKTGEIEEEVAELDADTLAEEAF